LHVCDAFDAMVSDQVYRQGMCVEDAMQEILKNTPAQFDAEVVEHLGEYLMSGHYRHQQQLVRTRVVAEEESEFDRLIELAGEVMELSHATRSTFKNDEWVSGSVASKSLF
jgi:HD-GYP domain-containing protein (c-di-GMP phosphodiesterase class II)